MTIRLLRPFDGYGIGDIVSLSSATETALVNQLAASFELGGGTFIGTNPPYDQIPEDTSSVNPTYENYDYQIEEARLSINSGNALTIPSYVAGNSDVVHPNVLYLPNGFGPNNYRWWMTITPYPAGDNAFENPSILISQDGKTWEVPVGLVNPIVAKPAGGYNADPFLMLSNDGSQLILIYKSSFGSTDTNYVITSKDGITWTNPSVISSYPNATRRLNSLSVWWDGTQYVSVSNDITQANNPLVRQTAPDILGPWSTPVNCTYTLPNGVTSLWHGDFRRLSGSGSIVGVMQTGTSSGGLLYAMKSVDNGVTWTFSSLVHSRGGSPSIYKCGFVPFGDTWVLYIGYLAAPPYRVEQGILSFDYTQYRQINGGYLSAGSVATLPVLGPYTLWDSFDRADSAVSLGTSTSGTVWTADTGTLGILSNRAYAPGAANNKAYVTLTSDIDIRATMAVIGDCHLTFRRLDSNNYWRARILSGLVYTQKIVAGGVGAEFNSVQTIAAGDELRILAIGSKINIYLNGLLVVQVVDGFAQTGTGHGLQISDTTARIDNLLMSNPNFY
jgi:hypothetical protein